MPKFDTREDYEEWKSSNALKRYGKTELEKSDQEWAKTESPRVRRKGAGWFWLVLALVAVIVCSYLVFGHR